MTIVSVIVPCFNEERRIRQLLDAINDQSFPINELEVVIADGLSTDQTRSLIADYQIEHPDLSIKVVDNIRRVIPSGLNRAIEASSGKYIIRMDAHSIPNREYIQKCVDGLEKGLGDNIGGVWNIKAGSSTWIAKSIAIAVSHPLGAGDALYRIGGVAQVVDTVPFGAFRKELFSRIGMFDESLLTNEDYEFNVRIRQSGGRIWMDPTISCVYYSRPTLWELAYQYWRYGYWKAQMARRYPNTLRWRQIIPPVFVAGLVGLVILSLGWYAARWLLAIIVILYTMVLFSIGIQISIKHRSPSIVFGVPLAITTIHFSWGSAFLWSILIKSWKINSKK
jgi:succinoglycan biosynthesis protein ExoA